MRIGIVLLYFCVIFVINREKVTFFRIFAVKVCCGQMTFGNNPLNWSTFVDINNANYFYRNMTDNRKRLREDDGCEFMPLSKRINNLHINNSLASTSASQDPSHINGIPGDNGISSSSSTDSERRHSLPGYDPGIDSSSSNYFYQNKLLYELHLERIQRSGQQFPF